MQMKSHFTASSKFGKPGLGVAPEAFDSIDMTFTMNKFVVPVIDSEVFFITKVNEAIVASPSIRMNDAFEIYPTSNNLLQRGSAAIRNNFGEDFPIAFKDTENNCFAESSTATFSFYASGTKVAFINFNLSRKRRLPFTIFGDSLPNFSEVSVDSISIQTGDFCNLRGIQIQWKHFHNLPDFPLRNFGTICILVFYCHNWILAHILLCCSSHDPN